MLLFFFSSRRRHTRLQGDWSSDVCSSDLLVEDRIVRGIRSGDKGRGRDGEELANFEPGSDLMAKATVLAERSEERRVGKERRSRRLTWRRKNKSRSAVL